MIGLNTTGDIYRPALGTGTGGWNEQTMTYSATPTYRDVRARISTMTAREKESLAATAGGGFRASSGGSALSVTATVRVFFEDTTDVAIRDRFVAEGRTYEVVEVDQIDRAAHHIETLCSYVQGVTG